MSHAEEQLYYACSNFCKSFFYLLCEKEKIRREYHWSDYEKDRAMEFSNERLNDAYSNLFKAMEDFENDKRGVVGENKYRLELRRGAE